MARRHIIPYPSAKVKNDVIRRAEEELLLNPEPVSRSPPCRAPVLVEALRSEFSGNNKGFASPIATKIRLPDAAASTKAKEALWVFAKANTAITIPRGDASENKPRVMMLVTVLTSARISDCANARAPNDL